jgi:glucosamine-6-phosphate deaminase
VFISVVENLNKYRVSCRNVHIFFLYEYANEKGQVAPWNSPYSRSGHFVRYFYNRLDAELRMPWENIHFFTTENVNSYSDELAALGGADVAYTAISWSGGIGAIDAESFPANTMEELMVMGSRLVTPMPEMIAHDSLRGMFGCAGDIGNVPPCAVTVGPKDLMAAKEWVDLEYLTSCGGIAAHQKFAVRLSMFGPISEKIPGSIMRLHKGTCYVSADVAKEPTTAADSDILEKIAVIKAKEEQ